MSITANTVLLILFGFSFPHNAGAQTLDNYLTMMKNNKAHSPFIVGEKKSILNPLYPKLIELANQLNSEVVWASSVSAFVLQLDFNVNRMVIKPTDEFDGWFDEYAIPNLVIVHQKARLITLIHELRHALHLGNHAIVEGNEFDLALQRNKKRIDRFIEQVEASNLGSVDKKTLREFSIRLIETCSEISAHEGDYQLSLAFKKPDAKDYAEFIQEYKHEFLQSYAFLKKNSFSQNQSFVEELKVALQKFMHLHGQQF